MAPISFEFLKWPGGLKPSVDLGPLHAASYSDAKFLRNIVFDIGLDDMTSAVLLCANELGTQAAYLAAQAAEKMLKGALLTSGHTPPHTHSLIKLLDALSQCAKSQVRDTNYLQSHLFDVAQSLEQAVGSSNTLTRYPDFTIQSLSNPYTEHPVVSFGEWTVYAVVKDGASIVDWCLFFARSVEGRGYRARQLCVECSGDWRPVYCCVNCLRWTCEEHSLITSIARGRVRWEDRMCDDCFGFLQAEA